MCGIVGILNKNGEAVDRRDLERMSAELIHRGPDGAGIWMDRNIGLAHRRLKIIDLSEAGQQPMVSSDNRFVISFNGEIYNYRELANEYLSQIELKSSSDTEILLELWALKGKESLNLIRGMFAFAIWDVKKQELMMARGPLGKKPLYYYEDSKRLLIGSEVKSLLSVLKTDLDRKKIGEYFAYEYTPLPETLWRGVKQLGIGEVAVFSGRDLKIEKYWQPKFLAKWGQSEKKILNRFDELLGHAVERRLVADVPVGLFLSGGLDSTTIGWYMRKSASGFIKSFSVDFNEKTYGESKYAQIASQALGTEHDEINFGLDEFKIAMDELNGLIDLPLGDASLVPTYWLSRKAREEVTVVLDGDGSDELLGGYGVFAAAAVAGWLNWLAGANKLVQKFPTNLNYFSLDFKIKSFFKGLGYPLPERNQVWLGAFSEKELQELLLDKSGDVYEQVRKLDNANLNVSDRVSNLLLHHYLQNDILVKLDRATMYNSLEARTPFLDVDLVDFCLRLPARYKNDKMILKKLMRGRIPDEIIDRSKQGFALPIGIWLASELKSWSEQVLASEKLERDGILNPVYVRKLLREHQEGKADHRKKLWTLLSWQLWWDKSKPSQDY